MSLLRASNTSLQQCDASHLAVYKPGLEGTTTKAGGSFGTDNATGCLPDLLLFCEEVEVDDSPLYCPSVAFRRPLQAAPNQLQQVLDVSPICSIICVILFKVLFYLNII